MADDRIAKLVPEYHAYLRQTANLHMTWFAFHFAANFWVLTAVKGQQVPVFCPLAVTWNLLGMIGTVFVGWYYVVTVRRMRAIEMEDGRNALGSETVPLSLWLAICALVAVVCAALAVGWALVR